MLSAMFSGNFSVAPDEDGTYFIDRNPKFFGMILDYLRKDSINISGLSSSELTDLQDEVEFYQIESLLALLKQSIKTPKIVWSNSHLNSIKISDSTLTAVGGSCNIVLATIPLISSGKHSWKMKVIKPGNYISIGVALNTIRNNQGYIGNSPDGWSLNQDGAIEHCGTYYSDVMGHKVPLQTNDVIQVTVDFDNMKISWVKNELLSWPALDIPTGLQPLFPAAMVSTSTSVTLID